MKKLIELNKKKWNLSKNDKIKIIILVFLIGGVVGFLYEEIFYLIRDGKLIKRGFLYGPYLPVYGWGALVMFIFLKPIKNKPVLVFLLSMLLTGILEYFTGKIMYSIWHHRWWDYTGLFLSIEGFVCLRSVLSFAIGGFLLLYILDPLIHLAYSKMSKKTTNIICITFIIIYLIDNIVKFFFPI